MRGGDGRKQVRRERGNAAPARQVVADKSDLANLRILSYEAFLSLLAPRASTTGRVYGSMSAPFRRVAHTATGSHRAASWPRAAPECHTRHRDANSWEPARVLPCCAIWLALNSSDRS